MSSKKQKCIAFNGDDPCDNLAKHGLYSDENGKTIVSYCDTHWDNLLYNSVNNKPVKINTKRYKESDYNDMEFESIYYSGACSKDALEDSDEECEVNLVCPDNPDGPLEDGDVSCYYINPKDSNIKYRTPRTPRTPKSPRSPRNLRSYSPRPMSPRAASPRPMSPRLAVSPRSVSYGRNQIIEFEPLRKPSKKRTKTDDDIKYLNDDELKTSTKYSSMPPYAPPKPIRDYGTVEISDNIKSPNRLVRGRYDIVRIDVAPEISITQDMVNWMDVLATTTDLKDAFQAIDFIRKAIEIRNKNNKNRVFDDPDEPTKWSVEESVLNYVAEKLAPYINDSERLELLISYIFDFDRRDLSRPFTFYGFTKFNKKIDENAANVINSTPYDNLRIYEGIKQVAPGVILPRPYDTSIPAKARRINDKPKPYKVDGYEYKPKGEASGSTPSGSGDFKTLTDTKEALKHLRGLEISKATLYTTNSSEGYDKQKATDKFNKFLTDIYPGEASNALNYFKNGKNITANDDDNKIAKEISDKIITIKSNIDGIREGSFMNKSALDSTFNDLSDFFESSIGMKIKEIIKNAPQKGQPANVTSSASIDNLGQLKGKNSQLFDKVKVNTLKDIEEKVVDAYNKFKSGISDNIDRDILIKFVHLLNIKNGKYQKLQGNKDVIINNLTESIKDPSKKFKLENNNFSDNTVPTVDLNKIFEINTSKNQKGNPNSKSKKKGGNSPGTQ